MIKLWSLRRRSFVRSFERRGDDLAMFDLAHDRPHDHPTTQKAKTTDLRMLKSVSGTSHSIPSAVARKSTTSPLCSSVRTSYSTNEQFLLSPSARPQSSRLHVSLTAEEDTPSSVSHHSTYRGKGHESPSYNSSDFPLTSPGRRLFVSLPSSQSFLFCLLLSGLVSCLHISGGR